MRERHLHVVRRFLCADWPRSKTGTPVDDRDYQVPFTFTGKLNKLTISVEPPKLNAYPLSDFDGRMKITGWGKLRTSLRRLPTTQARPSG